MAEEQLSPDSDSYDEAPSPIVPPRNGLWRGMFGWDTLFRWDVLGAVVPGIFIAAGFGLLGVDWFPHNLLISQICFSVAALMAVAKTIGQAVISRDSWQAKTIFCVVICGVILWFGYYAVISIQSHKTTAKVMSGNNTGRMGEKGAPPSTQGKLGKQTVSLAQKDIARFELAPYVIVKAWVQTFTNSQPVNITTYGLGAILHVITKRKIYVKQLLLSGERHIDCGEFDTIAGSDALHKDHSAVVFSGQHLGECADRKPFYRISWSIYPSGNSVEYDNEVFIRFLIYPTNSLPRPFLGSQMAYIGYDHSPPAEPDILSTLPSVLDLVHFTKSTDQNGPNEIGNFAYSNPVLRPEIVTGVMRFTVVTGENNFPIEPGNVKPVESTTDQFWQDMTVQDLFFGHTNPYFNGFDPVSNVKAGKK